METIYKEIITLIACLIIHEIGHYIAFRVFKYKPSITFTWYGILIGENIDHKLKVEESFIISLMGIITGAIPLLIFYTEKIMLIYIIMCSIDTVSILHTYENIKKGNAKKTLLQVAIDEIEDIKRKESIENE